MNIQKPNHTLAGQPQTKFNPFAEQQSLLAMPQYEAPYLVSYTDEDILEVLGPALTGCGSDSNLGPGC